MIPLVIIMAALTLLVAYFIVERACLRADHNRCRRMTEWLACELASRVALYVPNAKRRFKVKHPKVEEWLRAAKAATKDGDS